MGCQILGEKNIADFKEELLKNRYGIFSAPNWAVIVSETTEVGFLSDEYGRIDITYITKDRKIDEKLQQMIKNYAEPSKPI